MYANIHAVVGELEARIANLELRVDEMAQAAAAAHATVEAACDTTDEPEDEKPARPRRKR